VPTHVALLRGVNVGGHHRVAMDQLRRLVASLGHTDVATYIQSGNVVFTAGGSDPTGIAAELEGALVDRVGVPARVVVLSREQLAAVVAANPYADEPDPRRVHAVFLPVEPGPDAVAEVAAAVRRAAERGSRDRATVLGRVVYLHTPDGYGRSELVQQLGRTRTAAEGTARNWATVQRLLAICAA
jgi:uncharacterized protein (DUF1697 family)